jgi:hypothetical protein
MLRPWCLVVLAACPSGRGADEPTETPLLEREPVLSHTCSETRALTQVPEATWVPGVVKVVGNQAWLLRSDSGIVLSTLSADGTLGAGVTLDTDYAAAFQADLADREGALAVIWRHETGPTGELFRTAVVASDGTFIVATQDLEPTARDYLESPRLAVRKSGGFALLYADWDGVGRLRFAELDANAALTAGPTAIVESAEYLGRAGHHLAATSTGYALAYVDGPLGGTDVYFAALDAGGTPRFSPRRISRPAGGGRSSGQNWNATGSALLQVADRSWLAWTETNTSGSFDEVTGQTSVWIAVLDDVGEGKAYPLQAGASGRVDESPALFPVEDRVGVLWTQGTFISVCGGCVVDNDVRVVLIDGASMAPASPVVVHVHQGQNGYLEPHPVLVGGDLVTVTRLDFHALSYPGTGAIRCQAIAR